MVSDQGVHCLLIGFPSKMEQNPQNRPDTSSMTNGLIIYSSIQSVNRSPCRHLCLSNRGFCIEIRGIIHVFYAPLDILSSLFLNGSSNILVSYGKVSSFLSLILS